MKNYLIIGGGIAGVTVAHQLGLLGLTFDLVDDRPQSNSSKVAAGFWNPIVFKRLTKSYNAELLLPKMKEFYSAIEQVLCAKFMYEKPLLKIFSSQEERHRFIDKAIVSEVSSFLSEEVIEAIDGIDAPYGLGKVNDTGYIDTATYIERSIQHFEAKGSFVEAKVNHSEIIFYESGLKYRGNEYEKAIFCEGFHATKNPLFPELRLKPAKGELLTISCPELLQDYAFAKGVGLIPIGEQCFIVGSTYDWEDMTEQTTQKAREYLLGRLKEYLKLDFSVVGQKAGVRPSSHDRRPILGQSQVQKRAYILNGFGTKGVLYAPYYSEMLIVFATSHIEVLTK